MTLEELLKSLGYTDEQTTAITEGMKTNNIFTASEENLDVRYNKLKDDNNAVVKERDEGKTLIEQLQKAAKGNDEVQGKITEYENTIAQLQQEAQQSKLDSALKLALLNAKVTDTDYMAYKISEQLKKDGKTLELDDTGNSIKGIDEIITEQKKSNPTFFETERKKEVVPKELGKGELDGKNEPESLLDALKDAYNPSTEI